MGVLSLGGLGLAEECPRRVFLKFPSSPHINCTLDSRMHSGITSRETLPGQTLNYPLSLLTVRHGPCRKQDCFIKLSFPMSKILSYKKHNSIKILCSVLPAQNPDYSEPFFNSQASWLVRLDTLLPISQTGTSLTLSQMSTIMF